MGLQAHSAAAAAAAATTTTTTTATTTAHRAVQLRVEGGALRVRRVRVHHPHVIEVVVRQRAPPLGVRGGGVLERALVG